MPAKENCLSAFAEIASLNDVQPAQIKKYIKSIYDFTKSKHNKSSDESNALPKLIIGNLVNEQIWQQLELQNNEVLNVNVKNLENLISQQEYEHDQSSDENDEQESDDEDIGSMKSEEIEDDVENASEESEIENDEDVQLSDDQDKDSPKMDNGEYETDQEMEEFLESEEKERDDNEDEKDDEDENEEDIDYFDENLDESEDSRARVAKFKDFFRANEEEKKPIRNSFLEDLSEGEEENPYSNFELRQERLHKRIADIENNAIAEKPWTLKGEIKADSRPINSLLEEHMEFDRNVRPAPTVTGQVTVTLENIINQRIKDRAFDSVERKVKVVDEPFEYKKKLVINQEKSKESLAQIYEKEYLAGVNPETTTKEEEPETHKQIKKSIKTLFEQLDALSNYHYTPKPAIPELKVVSNIPALNTEEVGPLAISDAPVLPPEIVAGKPKGDILGKSERTSTDKKRERRKKKSKQKYHAKLHAEKSEKEKKTGMKNKKKDEEILKQLTKDSNTKKMVQSTDTVKTSKAFFEQIEEKQNKNTKALSKGKKRKANQSNYNAKKLKL